MKKICNFIRQVKACIGKIPHDKVLHYLVGVLVASFIAVVLPSLWWIATPCAAIVGLLGEAVDEVNYGGWCWADVAYTTAGGVTILIFQLL